MNSALRHQLRHLDGAILALLDERARLLRHARASDPLRSAPVEDLLRRHSGPFPPAGVTAVFAAIDEHCAAFVAEEAP
jgi:hypothetical protein